MPGWPGSSRGCGGPLNVSALSLPLLLLRFHFWLNHQITVCLHSQVLRFLLRQAGELPRLSLSFVNVGFSCIWRQTPEKATTGAAFSPSHLPWRVKRHPFHPTPPESQGSADKNQHADAFLRSPSVYLTPVDFDPPQETSSSVLACIIAVGAHKR